MLLKLYELTKDRRNNTGREKWWVIKVEVERRWVEWLGRGGVGELERLVKAKPGR